MRKSSYDYKLQQLAAGKLYNLIKQISSTLNFIIITKRINDNEREEISLYNSEELLNIDICNLKSISISFEDVFISLLIYTNNISISINAGNRAIIQEAKRTIEQELNLIELKSDSKNIGLNGFEVDNIYLYEKDRQEKNILGDISKCLQDLASTVENLDKRITTLENRNDYIYLDEKERDEKLRDELGINDLLKSEQDDILRNEELSKMWQSFLLEIKKEVSNPVFKTWFIDLRPVKYVENKILLQAPNHFICDWVNSRYKDKISKILSQKFKINAKIIIYV